MGICHERPGREASTSLPALTKFPALSAGLLAAALVQTITAHACPTVEDDRIMITAEIGSIRESRSGKNAEIAVGAESQRPRECGIARIVISGRYRECGSGQRIVAVGEYRASPSYPRLSILEADSYDCFDKRR